MSKFLKATIEDNDEHRKRRLKRAAAIRKKHFSDEPTPVFIERLKAKLKGENRNDD